MIRTAYVPHCLAAVLVSAGISETCDLFGHADSLPPSLALLPFSSKPKSARVKRALEEREPKVVENPKTAIFVHGNKTGERVAIALKELVRQRCSRGC